MSRNLVSNALRPPPSETVMKVKKQHRPMAVRKIAETRPQKKRTDGGEHQLIHRDSLQGRHCRRPFCDWEGP